MDPILSNLEQAYLKAWDIYQKYPNSKVASFYFAAAIDERRDIVLNFLKTVNDDRKVNTWQDETVSFSQYLGENWEFKF